MLTLKLLEMLCGADSNLVLLCDPEDAYVLASVSDTEVVTATPVHPDTEILRMFDLVGQHYGYDGIQVLPGRSISYWLYEPVEDELGKLTRV